MTGKIITIVLLLAGVLGVAAAPRDPGVDYSESPEAVETLLNLSVVDGVFAVFQEWEESVELPVQWTAIRTFSTKMPEPYRDLLPVKDGWDQEFLCMNIRGWMVVLSKGENGVHEYLKDVESIEDIEKIETEMKKGNVPGYGDDIILIGAGNRGEIVNEPKRKPAISSTAMADMRSIATAVESFAIDSNRYPTQGSGLAPLDVLREELEPLYIKNLPMLDPWGEPFLYWSDGAEYILISSGADKILDRTYPLSSDSLGNDSFLGEVPDSEFDLVFVNGLFVQWHPGQQP